MKVRLPPVLALSFLLVASCGGDSSPYGPIGTSSAGISPAGGCGYTNHKRLIVPHTGASSDRRLQVVRAFCGVFGKLPADVSIVEFARVRRRSR